MNEKTEEAAAKILKRMEKGQTALDWDIVAQVRGMGKMTNLTSDLIRTIGRGGR